MCGLVTVISKLKGGLYHSDIKIFTELLFADQLRGGDGTGIIYNVGKEIKTLKAPVGSSDFVNHALYDKAIAAAVKSGNFMVGHNRAATKGGLTQQNTHPFRENHITLVHNGTLPYHKNLADTEVDSHAICNAFAANGAKDTLKKINGAYALIWTDSKQKTLNFVRNSQRPLFLVETEDLFIFVSEKELAYWICARNNQKILDTTEVPTHTLIQFEFGTWDKYETQKVDYYVPPAFVPQITKITPYTAPTHTKNGYKLGEVIKFIPVKVDMEFGCKLLGEYEDQFGESIEIKYWAKNKEDAERLLTYGILVGKISHEVFNTTTKSTSLVVSNVGKYEGTTVVPYGHKTANGLTLTNIEYKELTNKCSYCSTIFQKKLISACNVTKKSDGTYSALCPDCTSWFNEDALGDPFNSYYKGN